MAMNFGKGNRSIAFAPTAAFPLNANSYFESYDLALAAALTAKAAGDTTTKYYFGQEIAVAQMNNGTPVSAKLYIIAPVAQEDGTVVGTLQEVGSATNGDGQTIELDEGVLSLKDFGKRYYKYVAAAGEVAAHYELVDVDETNQWSSGLEPKVVLDGEEYVIGWYEPNPTTIDGVQDQVTAVQGDVAQAKTDIENLQTDVDAVEEDVALITDILNGTTDENGEKVRGLVEMVETLEDDVDILEGKVANTYTKEEVNNLVSGVFHFKGTAESFETLPADALEGDVYQVGEKEYAWNGDAWVELGYTIDLTAYATKNYVDTEVGEVNTALETLDGEVTAIDADLTTLEGRVDTVEGEIDALQEQNAGFVTQFETVNGKITALEQKDTEFAGNFETINGKIDALEKKDAEFATQFETISGKITALESADTAFDTRVGNLEGKVTTLETNVGSPSEGFTSALFPAVEALQERIDGLTAQGGEPNLINGVSINGVKLTPDASTKIVDMPIFAGATAGLVPVIAEAVTNPAVHALNAEGNWFDVEALIDSKLDEALVWEAIAE